MLTTNVSCKLAMQKLAHESLKQKELLHFIIGCIDNSMIICVGRVIAFLMHQRISVRGCACLSVCPSIRQGASYAVYPSVHPTGGILCRVSGLVQLPEHPYSSLKSRRKASAQITSSEEL